MVARVVELLRRGVEPARIRVLMFNRSAREEFQRRLATAVPAGGGGSVPVMTFHSAGYRLLERLVREGRLPARRIESADWVARRLVRTAFEQETEGAPPEDEELETFLAFVDAVKADIRPAEAVHAEAATRLGEALPSRFLAVYERFEALREEQGIRLLADLIHEPVQALLQDERLAQRFRNHFDHLMIDEYQDVNEAQQQLIRCIAGSRAEVMVVGDPDQCVYQWRGARPEYLVRRFQEDFPAAVSYTLPHTFRFGHTVALLGNHAVVRNRQRDRKLCLAAAGNPPTTVQRCADNDPELYRRLVAEHRRRGGRLDALAILARLYSLAAPAELELLEAGIPFRLDGQGGLFQRREVCALLGYLRHICGWWNGPLGDGRSPEVLLVEMLMLPVAGLRRDEARGIARRCMESSAPIGATLARVARELPAWKGRRLSERVDSLRVFEAHPATDPVGDVLDEVVGELDLYASIRGGAVSAEAATDRAMVVDALRRFAASGGWSVAEFVERCDELMARFDHWQQSPPEEAVHITSIHRAKGLEWPVVAVPGLAEGTFPYLGGGDGAADLEAERRLYYVAVTRAQERLYLIHPQDPRLERALAADQADRFDPRGAVASRFVAESEPERSQRAGRALDDGAPEGVEAATPVLRDYLDALGASVPTTEEVHDVGAK